MTKPTIGDQNLDILWRNNATGQNWVYFMNGANISTSVPINTEPDLSWEIVNVN